MAGKAHLRFALGADQRLDHLLTSQRHAHRIGAMDQETGASRLGAGKITGRIARAKLHSGSLAASAVSRAII